MKIYNEEEKSCYPPFWKMNKVLCKKPKQTNDSLKERHYNVF